MFECECPQDSSSDSASSSAGTIGRRYDAKSSSCGPSAPIIISRYLLPASDADNDRNRHEANKSHTLSSRWLLFWLLLLLLNDGNSATAAAPGDASAIISDKTVNNQTEATAKQADLPMDSVPPASKCLMQPSNGSSSSYLSMINTNNLSLPIPISDNSFQLRLKPPLPQPQPQPQHPQHPTQVPFASICNGWINMFDKHLSRKQLQPPGYWVLDTRRAALVAKFDYYDRNEFTAPYDHIAKLKSPTFRYSRPRSPPIDHNISSNNIDSTCTIKFRSYSTTPAQLQLNLHFWPAAKPAPRSSNLHHMTPQLINKHDRHLLIDNKQLFSAHSNRHMDINMIDSEDQIWRDQLVAVPLDEQKYHRLEYYLEFLATPSIVTSAMSHSNNNLRRDIAYALAIANFSMSPRCFEEKDNHQALQQQPQSSFFSGWLSFNNDADSSEEDDDGDDLSSDSVGLFGRKGFIRTHKMLIGTLLVLVIIVTSFTYMCQLLLHSGKQQHQRHQNSNSHHYRYPYSSDYRKSQQANSILLALLTWAPCCHLLVDRDRRCRVYQSSDSNTNGHLSSNHHNNNDFRRHNMFYKHNNSANHHHRFNGNGGGGSPIDHRCLRPLSAVLDDVELNENPNYLAAGGASSAHLPSPYNQWMMLSNGMDVAAADNAAGWDGMRSPSGFSLTASNNNCSYRTPLDSYHIDRKRLTLTQPLGKGAFGEVYQGSLVYHCSSDGSTTKLSCGPDESEYDENGCHLDSHSMKVAVKTLTDERMSRRDFLREAFNMSLVSHRNIVKLIGVCFEEKPLFIVMELLEGGNLKNFLIKNRDKGYHQPMSASSRHFQDTPAANGLSPPDSLQNNNGNHIQQQYVDTGNWTPATRLKLSMGDLLVFALDIARACDYLQKKRFIHRDLAARNCLLTTDVRKQMAPNAFATNGMSSHSPVGSNRHGGKNGVQSSNHQPQSPPSALDVQANHKVDLEQVYLSGYMDSGMVAKLADFGMTRDIYSNDYYRMCHKELPVRWMPPECLDGVANSKSDVWSFGVFLWELFSMGQLPYQHLLDNQQVISFIQSRRQARPLRTNSSLAATSTTVTTPTPATMAQSTSSVAIGGGGNSHLQRDSAEPLLPHHQSANDQVGGNGYTNCVNNKQITTSKSEVNEQVTMQQQQCEPALLETDENEAAEAPPLAPPHDNTPHPIYSIMCACWASNPEDRPQFEEIANRLYWCLQMPDVLQTSLPCFYEQHTPGGAAHRRAAAAATAAAALAAAASAARGASPASHEGRPTEDAVGRQQGQQPAIILAPPPTARSSQSGPSRTGGEQAPGEQRDRQVTEQVDTTAGNENADCVSGQEWTLI